jgi:hypothetical protein
MAVVMYRESGDHWGLANALTNLMIALSTDGRAEEARTRASEAVTILDEFDDPRADRVRGLVLSVLA